MATAPTVLKSGEGLVIGPFIQSVADSVDGLLYMEDPSNAGHLIVAAGAHLCGVPTRRAKVGEYVSLRVSGLMVATASGVIAVNGPITPDSAGKIKAATIGSDDVMGYLVGPACTTDGDIVSIVKRA